MEGRDGRTEQGGIGGGRRGEGGKRALIDNPR